MRTALRSSAPGLGELWNRKTGIMVPQVRESMSSPHQIVGSVETSEKNSESSPLVSIAFESPAHLRIASDIRNIDEFARDGTFKLAISPLSQPHARELLKNKAPSMEAHVDTRAAHGSTCLSARVLEVTEVLNDLVCVLKVSEFDPYASCTRQFAYRALPSIGRKDERPSNSKGRKPKPQASFDNIPIINVNGRLS